MKTKREHFCKNNEHGNALVYVLIAIILFAALSFTLSRQTDTNESSDIPSAHAESYAAQIIAYAATAKSALDQMLIAGTKINDIDFTLPSQAGFNIAPTITKIYHPDGGGLTPSRLPSQSIQQNIPDPVAGWYMGRFNNVEWTKTSANDVILIAFQINKKTCEALNLKITGSTAIPKMTATIRNVMIDDAFFGGSGNTDLTTDPSVAPICAECHGRSSLCIEDSASTTYGFYTIIADQ
jgi:hypothetical protein